MRLDRELQYEILQELSEVYPDSVNLDGRYDYDSEEYKKFVANLNYLVENELISKNSVLVSQMMCGTSVQPNLGQITHRGLDFLSDDGGLSAILNVVTIKFETEQLKTILEANIRSADIPEEKKNRLIEALWELPAEGVKSLTMKIVEIGWANKEALVELVKGFVS